MKRTLIFAIALMLPLLVHASPAQLIDTDTEDVGASVAIIDEPQAYELTDADTDLIYDEASRNGTGGGCQTVHGVASVYGTGKKHDPAHQKLAGPGYLDPNAMTAAMLAIPMGRTVRVTGSNGRTITVRVNDHGPYVKGRVIDLTTTAASALGFSGTMPVTVTTCGA